MGHQLLDISVLSSPRRGQVGAGSQQRNIHQLHSKKKVHLLNTRSVYKLVSAT